MNFRYSTSLPSWFTEKSSQESLEDFIFHLDTRATDATITSLNPGRSGASVFFVRRVSNGETLFPLVLKLSDAAKLIRRERDNYNTHISSKLANAPTLHDTAEYILAYTYTGALFRAPLTLREGYSSTNASTLARLVGRLVETLVGWYVTSNSSHTNVEQMELRPPLNEVLHSLGGDFESYRFLADWWTDFRKHGLLRSSQRIFRCHGDLNCGNVMFDGDSVDPLPFLVDFGSVGNHIAHWDFAKLDRDLKTRLYLGEARARERSLTEMKRAVQDADLSEESEDAVRAYMAQGTPEHKLLACIHTLRARVRYMDGAHLFERAYYQSLLFATLSVLYRKGCDTEDDGNVQKTLACVSATALLSRLLQRSIPATVDAGSADPLPQEVDAKPLVGVRRLRLQAGKCVQMFCDRIRHAVNGDIRFAGITGFALVRDPNFLAALEDQLEAQRTLTLHVYILRVGTSSFNEFYHRSNEPADVIQEKLALVRDTLHAMGQSGKHKNLRIILYEYDAMPTINLIQIGNEIFFRPYKIGEKLSFLDVYHVVRGSGNEDIDRWLDNIIGDLTLRSEVTTLKWSSSFGAPWPR